MKPHIFQSVFEVNISLPISIYFSAASAEISFFASVLGMCSAFSYLSLLTYTYKCPFISFQLK